MGKYRVKVTLSLVSESESEAEAKFAAHYAIVQAFGRAAADSATYSDPEVVENN